MRVLRGPRWHAWCACGWQGKPRRKRLVALDDCIEHWCDAEEGGQAVRVPSYDKGTRRVER